MGIFRYLVLLTTGLLGAAAHTINDTDKLASDLLNGYNKIIRPGFDQTRVLQVNVSYDIGSIQAFNEVEGKISVYGSFQLSWIDDRLTWDPTMYNYTYSVLLPIDMVWKPRLLLVNPAEAFRSLVAEWSVVRNLYSGLSLWYASDILRASCTVNIKYYPFDVQTCYLILSTIVYGGSELVLYPVNKEAPKQYFFENGEWELLKTEARAGDTGTSIYVVQLVIRRRPIFALTIVIIPIIFISLLNMMVFLLPADSGERISFTVTVLLALTVFLTIVSESIPKTSSPVSILCFFIGAQILLSTIICFVSILNLRLFFKDDGVPLPSWLCHRVGGSSYEEYNRKRADGNLSATVLKNSEIKYSTNGTIFMSQKSSQTADSQNMKRTSSVTWKDISLKVDKFMFAFSLMYFLVSCFIYTLVTVFKDGSEIDDFSMF